MDHDTFLISNYTCYLTPTKSKTLNAYITMLLNNNKIIINTSTHENQMTISTSYDNTQNKMLIPS